MERQFPVCVHTLKNVLLRKVFLEHGEEIDEEDVFLIREMAKGCSCAVCDDKKIVVRPSDFLYLRKKKVA